MAQRLNPLNFCKAKRPRGDLTRLVLVISTLDREHNFLGLFDQNKKIWIKELEFRACGAEEFFPIFKEFISLKILLNLEMVVAEQARGSFSGLRLQTAVVNSLKIKNKNLELFGIKAKNLGDIKRKVVNNQDLVKTKNFLYPEYPGSFSIHR